METHEFEIDALHCIRIGEAVRVVIADHTGTQVRIGIDAPGEIAIVRKELLLPGDSLP